MNYYDGELESIADSIERYLNKQAKIRILAHGLFLVFIIYVLYNSIIIINTQNPEQKIPTSNLIITVVLYTVSFIGLAYTSVNSVERRAFKNMQEKIYFYLFYSWKYHNEEKSKKYLKNCINALDNYLYSYKKLAYTEDIYSTFDTLHDTLIYYIYPRLGVRAVIKKQEDLSKQTLAWNEFKLLSSLFYQNCSIQSINEKVSNLRSFFERDYDIKIDENQLIKAVRLFTSWNVETYKNSLLYRFLFYLLVTGILDYILISNNLVENDAVLSATILIPIMAPYYLAQNKVT